MEVDMSTNAPLDSPVDVDVFVSPHKDGDVYRVSVFAIDDYFDVFDWRSGSYCAAER
jgi:hypothetical protein